MDHFDAVAHAVDAHDPVAVLNLVVSIFNFYFLLSRLSIGTNEVPYKNLILKVKVKNKILKQ